MGDLDICWDSFSKESHDLLPKQLLATLLCPSFEAFQAICFPFVFGKDVCSPNKRIKKHGRHASFTNIFGKKPLPYIQLCERLCEQERFAHFSTDQLLSTIIVLDSSLQGSVAEASFFNVIDRIEFGVRCDPMQPEQVWKRVLMGLVDDVQLFLCGVDQDVVVSVRQTVSSARDNGYLPLKYFLTDVWNCTDDDVFNRFLTIWKPIQTICKSAALPDATIITSHDDNSEVEHHLSEITSCQQDTARNDNSLWIDQSSLIESVENAKYDLVAQQADWKLIMKKADAISSLLELGENSKINSVLRELENDIGSFRNKLSPALYKRLSPTSTTITNNASRPQTPQSLRSFFTADVDLQISSKRRPSHFSTETSTTSPSVTARTVSPSLSSHPLAESFRRRASLLSESSISSSRTGHISPSIVNRRARELHVEMTRRTPRADIIRSPINRQRNQRNHNVYDEEKCRWVSAIELSKSREESVSRFPTFEEMRYSNEAIRLIYY